MLKSASRHSRLPPFIQKYLDRFRQPAVASIEINKREAKKTYFSAISTDA